MAVQRSTGVLARRIAAAILAALLGLALTAISAPGASAASAPSSRAAAVSLSAVGAGGGLLLEGSPGSVLGGAVRVQNLSGEPVTVVLQAADIRTAANGNADYVTRGLSQAVRWVSLGSSAVDLAPHEQREVQFTLTVPARESGSHYRASSPSTRLNSRAPASPAARAASSPSSPARRSRSPSGCQGRRRAA